MYLQIKQLNKSYGSRQVVSNIDLTMEKGEILSLLGPSGCGKTTILRMIAGLVAPDSGQIEVGERVFYDGKREMPVEERGLGMVFQDYALWPHMTVARNIAFSLLLHRISSGQMQKRVQELLDLVNLPDFGDRYPHQLSGGQQQRVAVARALANEPGVLLLDEPLSSLDTALRETMGAELVQLLKRLNITTINVTHDQNEAMSMSDRIMVLRNGKVQQIGTPTELYLHPVNTFVASFMGPVNKLPGTCVDTTPGISSLHLDDTAFDEQVMIGQISDAISKQFTDNSRPGLLCRPNDVRIYREAPQDEQPNILCGAVVHSSFVGGRWRTHIAVGKGQAHNILAFATTPLQPQESVWVAFPPEHCLIIPEL
jgi:ABC-type Fe3+/spermidine/putrescine transport system ATPase subunit